MIEKILSPWYIFKSMVVVGHAFDTVLRKFYIRDPYKRILHWYVFRAKQSAVYTLNIGLRKFYVKNPPSITSIKTLKRPTFFNVDYETVKASISHQKSLRVVININSTSCRLFTIVGVAWFSEKMATNVKFRFPNLEDPFENSTLISTKMHRHEKFAPLKHVIMWENYAKCAISSEYGHKIISKLSIKKELYRQADEWIDNNLQGNWVGVHFRGTDATRCCMETYITHLTAMIGKGYKIFACSDQIQFINQMKEAFPGKVFCRDIKRSHNFKSLHRIPREKRHQQRPQQQQDALIDILILSRTELIYTTGSWFVDIVRFFNPAVKIVSFDSGRERFDYHKRLDNFIIPPQNILHGQIHRNK